MTPSVIESHLRSRRFHAEIARRAALVPQREDRTYFIPNTPFGVRKIQPPKIIPHVPEPNYLCCMWFYDLVFSNPKRERAVLVSDIQHAACRLFNISLNDMIADRRFAQFVRARQIAMYMAKVYTPRSLPEIGRRFGGRDHTTVLHAVRKIGKLVETNPDVAADVAALRVELGL